MSLSSGLPSVCAGAPTYAAAARAEVLRAGHPSAGGLVARPGWNGKSPRSPGDHGLSDAVELRGIEPLTFSMRTRRATNCAIAPAARRFRLAMEDFSRSVGRSTNRLVTGGFSGWRTGGGDGWNRGAWRGRPGSVERCRCRRDGSEGGGGGRPCEWGGSDRRWGRLGNVPAVGGCSVSVGGEGREPVLGVTAWVSEFGGGGEGPGTRAWGCEVGEGMKFGGCRRYFRGECAGVGMEVVDKCGEFPDGGVGMVRAQVIPGAIGDEWKLVGLGTGVGSVGGEIDCREGGVEGMWVSGP